MLEKTITNNIMRYLKTLDRCFFYKHHGGYFGPAGIPDIICCYRGRFLALEVKQEKGRVTKLQDATLRRIRDADGKAYVVRSVDDVKKIIERMC